MRPTTSPVPVRRKYTDPGQRFKNPGRGAHEPMRRRTRTLERDAAQARPLYLPPPPSPQRLQAGGSQETVRDVGASTPESVESLVAPRNILPGVAGSNHFAHFRMG